ncbi:hypothetical protein GRZ55_06730 [Chelativorans sp. ZYF759]|uniref:hypothetical protein n=1 Tax=Chelativorans sp. ZYF759 TaxID=2692213 RepID=UPI00145CDC11|nr:hypothetical protein [Chelativorans sp. ZYF759]NMG38935.1 hypothetical protein [Chelativorans sp. ZYF759]
MLTRTPRNKIICRLRDRAPFDAVIVEPIRASDASGNDHGLVSSAPFTVRSSVLQNESPGTFWDIELDTGKKPSAENPAPESPVLLARPGGTKHFHSSVSMPSASFALPDGDSPRTPRTVSKLVVALLPDRSGESPASTLRLDGISAPSDIEADYLGIGHDLFVRRDALTIQSGRYFAQIRRTERFPAFALTGRHHDIVLSGRSLRIFMEDPSVQSRPVDIRTRTEKDQALRDLLERTASSGRLDASDREVLARAANLVGSLSRGGLDADELEVAKATLADIVDRTPVVEAIPKLLRDDPAFSEDLRSSMENARREALVNIEEEFVVPRREAEAELADARRALENAKRDLSLARERSRAYADATASAKAEMKSNVEEAVIAYLGESAVDLATRVSSLESGGTLRETSPDIDLIVDRLLEGPGSLARIASALASANAETERTERRSRPSASNPEDRAGSLRMWAYDAHVQFADLVIAFVASMTWRVPTFVGPHRDAAAEAICNAVGGGEHYVVHCDPTMISFADLVGRKGDFFTPLRNAIEEATENADVLVPVLLRNINYAPCQFWLQALADRKDGYPLPRNLLVISTLAEDGGRIGIPETLWDHLVPLTANRPSGDAPTSPLPDAEAYKSMQWTRAKDGTRIIPEGLMHAALNVCRAACGSAFDTSIAHDGHSLLTTAVAYLDLEADDIRQGFEAALHWKRRSERSDDELIAETINILKG